jgi:hypothetical protein
VPRGDLPVESERSLFLKHMKRVTFLCPALTTGGPEAIHQASQALNQAGLPSDIAYYGPGGALAINEGRLEVVPPGENPCTAAYAEYEPVTCSSALLRPHHLIVLPEVLAGRQDGFGRAAVALWWLSVDNSPAATDPSVRRGVTASRSVKHLHQSAYAAEFLARLGVSSSPLGDFTTAEFTSHRSTGPNADPAIAYNPVKGADLARDFFSAHPDLAQVPVRGMSRVETAAMFRRTMLYIDFGHLPGKDRLPREAAASGSVVFLHDRGSGHHHEDFPVPDFFRFTEADVVSGALHQRVLDVQRNPEPFWREQARLREGILAERAELVSQVAHLRGRDVTAERHQDDARPARDTASQRRALAPSAPSRGGALSRRGQM